MKLARVFKLLLVAAAALTAHANEEHECQGGFDVFFLFDRSSSTMDNFQNYMIPFARESTLTQLAKGPKPTGHQGTNMGGGLDYVDAQDTTTNKIVFIISDGCDNDYFKAHTRQRVAELKAVGVEIFIIFIPSGGIIQCPDYLKQISSAPVDSHYLPILTGGFAQLNRPEFIDGLLEKSCLQIDAVSPEMVCNSTRRTLRVTGKGFTRTDDLSKFTCKFSVLPCMDDTTWRDGKGSPCSVYAQPWNQQFCVQNAEAREKCPVSCGTCPEETQDFCSDNPKYAGKCAEWVAAGECRATPDFMMQHCQKSCDACGISPAVVVNGNELLCQSPPLGLVDRFSFEVTRNGITWTQGDVRVQTYDCQGSEEDDPPLMSQLELSLSVRIPNPPTFTRTQRFVDVVLQVVNDGDVAINGPVGVYSTGFDGAGVSCEHDGVIAAKATMQCRGRKVINANDMAQGFFETTVYAQAQISEDEVLKSDPVTSRFFRADVPTPQPTRQPTTAQPTRQPTTAQPTTAKPTPQPTAQPTTLASVSVELSSEPQFTPADKFVSAVVRVTNDGDADMTGLVQGVAEGMGSGRGVSCPAVVLKAGDSVECRGRRTIANQDRRNGGFDVKMFARAQVGDKTVDSEPLSVRFNFYKPPTAAPTPALLPARPTPEPTQELVVLPPVDTRSFTPAELPPTPAVAAPTSPVVIAPTPVVVAGAGSYDSSSVDAYDSASYDGSDDGTVSSLESSREAGSTDSGDAMLLPPSGSSNDGDEPAAPSTGSPKMDDTSSSGAADNTFAIGTAGQGSSAPSDLSSTGVAAEPSGGLFEPGTGGYDTSSSGPTLGGVPIQTLSAGVDECSTWYNPISCIPWWAWLIAAATVLLILAAILFACLKGREQKPPPPADPAALEELNAAAAVPPPVPAAYAPANPAAVPPPLPAGYGNGRPANNTLSENHIRYQYQDGTL